MIRQPQTLPASPAIAQALRAGLSFGMLQQADELIAFLTWLDAQQIALNTVIEIGAHDGGSAAVFCSLATSRVVSLDLPDGIGGGIPIAAVRMRDVKLRAQFPNYISIVGDSHDYDSLLRVQEALADTPADLLFIDGDHSYRGVSSDYQMYAPLVREGGVIAFHDIVASADPRCRDVARFWQSLPLLTDDQKYTFTTAGASWGGIGAIRKG